MASSTDIKDQRRKAEYKKRAQLRTARLEIVARLYKRGYSMRDVRSEVMRIQGLETYSLRTVKRDIDTLLAEWRDARLNDTDQLVTLELARIDEMIRELWDQWEKSKNNYTATSRFSSGHIDGSGNDDDDDSDGSGNRSGKRRIRPTRASQSEKDIVRCGDPAFIREIRKLLEMRYKLLGLNAPDKLNITGDTFTSLLIESGLLDDAERESGIR